MEVSNGKVSAPMRHVVAISWLLFVAAIPALGQAPAPLQPLAAPDRSALPSVFYSTESQVSVYTQPDSARPYLHLAFREPVRVVDRIDDWSRIETMGGASGFVASDVLSNVWIVVSKHRRTVSVYRGGVLVKKMAADLGRNFFADKKRRGSVRDPDQWRTPDGIFYIAKKNPRSEFHRALVLNYPNSEDARRGLDAGLVSQGQYDAIVRAERTFTMPPMNTALGGWIEIHGHGTGARNDWTQGCIAIRDEEIDEIYDWVTTGTPVIIEP